MILRVTYFGCMQNWHNATNLPVGLSLITETKLLQQFDDLMLQSSVVFSLISLI